MKDAATDPLRPGRRRGGARAKQAKHAARKRQLADSAIAALKRHGYANTTLRDIARHSDLSLGMLHYYFDSKDQLLIYCVRLYKERFVADITQRIAGAADRADALRALAAGLARSITEAAQTHRLWYDIRTQSLFDPVFRPHVRAIQDDLAALVAPFAPDPEDPEVVGAFYGALDGVFLHWLQRHLDGPPLTAETLSAAFLRSLETHGRARTSQ